jgi:hypothetical protein
MEIDRENDGRVSAGAMVGAGCFSAVAGLFGGGMIAVLVAKIIGSIQGCKPTDGIPACNWGAYAGIGMIAGVVILPLVSILRLRSRR